MIRNIIMGVAVGLLTLYLWEKYEESRGKTGGLFARVTRMWSTPAAGNFPLNGTLALGLNASAAGGGCSCS
jgi:hypothetical protein